MTEAPLVAVTRSAGVATIRLQRASKRNALNSALLGQLHEILQSVAGDFPATRVIVLLGDGPSFCAGADITEFEQWDAASLHGFLELGSEAFSLVATMPQPVIAGVQGFALGGGLELALACDIRLADETARFGLPEITIGGVPGWGGTVRLQEVIGRGRASYLTLTGEQLGAEEAKAVGLVHDVVAVGELEARCHALAERLAAMSPTALRLAKHAVAMGSPFNVPGQSDVEQYANLACMLSDERKSAVESFTGRS
ncbi:MAG TPA: enoyl-CoA hydratase/isomerase family protein [Terrimesophilobacter sp.]|jgi:Enoyl-CoA hydratase/carnithine racemase|uniref:enoyl-CoA hydratase/isomerase family protein n=1 Tax=Terrimesophilobacter sp. TaxID=2906435 RepID=UPI002F93D13C